MRFLVNCPFGLSSILGNELKHIGLNPHHSFETGVYVEGEYCDMMTINLWSRIANKVFLQVAFGNCSDFDKLFALMQTVNRENYVLPGQNIVVSVHTKGSKLESTRTIQAISNKAIYKQLSPTGTWEIDKEQDSLDIFVMIINDQASIFINSSGDPLHQRGYRTQTGEAPIKENLAAALVILSRWKYSTPLLDPFCGSGTIGIEAAMLARNIAPGLNRKFAFENWENVDMEMLAKLKSDAKNKQYNDKKYQIDCNDIDEKTLEIARNNAKNAGVSDTINFTQKDFLSDGNHAEGTTIISNPPYGKRLTGSDLQKIYKHLINTILNIGTGGFITSYKDCEQYLDKDRRHKKLFNGADECEFWYR